VGTTYDTEKIREAARQVGKVSERLDQDVLFQLKRARESMDGLQGKTAEALDQALQQRERAVRVDAQHLTDIAAKLKAYAGALEAVDRRMANLMGGKG